MSMSFLWHLKWVWGCLDGDRHIWKDNALEQEHIDMLVMWCKYELIESVWESWCCIATFEGIMVLCWVDMNMEMLYRWYYHEHELNMVDMNIWSLDYWNKMVDMEAMHELMPLGIWSVGNDMTNTTMVMVFSLIGWILIHKI